MKRIDGIEPLLMGVALLDNQELELINREIKAKIDFHNDKGQEGIRDFYAALDYFMKWRRQERNEVFLERAESLDYDLPEGL